MYITGTGTCQSESVYLTTCFCCSKVAKKKVFFGCFHVRTLTGASVNSTNHLFRTDILKCKLNIEEELKSAM